MNFKRENIKDYYLRDTCVENIFINEYLTEAPGDYVKVYLFALMYADFDLKMTNETIAKHLSIDAEDVLKAWTYWEKMGIIKKHYLKPEDKYRYKVEFLNLKEMVYGKKLKSKKTDSKVPEQLKSLMDDDKAREMYKEIERITGRLFEGKEPAEIMSWIADYNASPEVIIYAYSYCVSKKKPNTYKYVGAIVKEWSEQNLKTIEQVENHLSEVDNRHYLYKRILKALGFSRNATEEEKRIINTWFDEMGFPIEKILEACKKTSGISNPNINYINSILKSWNSGGSDKPAAKGEDAKTSYIGNVLKYYEELRLTNEKKAEEKRQQVYGLIPRVKEIEEETRDVGLQISRVMLSGAHDKENRLAAMKKRINDLNQEKAFLMTENNFSIDYMDIVYDCTLCRDTGTLDSGKRCSCFAKRLEAIQKND